MLDGILHLFARRAFVDVLIDVIDLSVVTYGIYRALLLLRGTRAMQMGTGLGVLFLVYVVAKWAGFVTLYNVLSTLLSSVIILVVVVFQNDIRRALMRVGVRPLLVGNARLQESKVIDEVVAAVTELARHRIGALICFEQDANLDEFVVGQGTVIDAQVQRELLVSVFVPDGLNKLHDGALLVRNLRIARAGMFFPMPETKNLDKSLGSRHRAALGISEETDAVVVVVSEERGSISLCFNGNIVPSLDGQALRQALQGLFGQRARAKKTGTGVPQGAYRPSLRPPVPAPVSVKTPLAKADVMPAAPRVPKFEDESMPAGRLADLAEMSRPMTPADPVDTPRPLSSRPPPPPSPATDGD